MAPLYKRGFTRRQFLLGAGGACVALPTLASLPAHASAPPPKRFLFFFHPNGVDTNSFTPIAGGSQTEFTLGASNAALAPWRDRLLWTSGLNMSVAVSGPGEQHQRGMGALLTGQGLASGSFVGNDGTKAGWALGQSLDQALVPVIGSTTFIGSLQLGVNVRERDVSGVISYSGAGQPLLPQNDPAQTYRTLFFLDGPGRQAASTANLRRKTVLDAVGSQLASLRNKVSASDAQRLDQHLTMVRDLEKRIAALPEPPAAQPATPTPNEPSPAPPADGYAEGCAPSSEPRVESPETVAAMPEVARLQVELAVMAFRCDLTRVITLSFGDAKNHVSLPFINVPNDVHNLSHLGDADPRRAELRSRDEWVMRQIAFALERLDATREADGSSLLDNTLMMWGSELARGNIHSHTNMPFVLGGGALGWQMGRYVPFSARPHNELLLSILRGFGSSAASFGDPAHCAGELTGL